MVNMQLSAEQAKEMSACCAEPGEHSGPRYPYGLSLYLDTESLAKLGITELPKVGAQLKLQALVTVTEVGMHQRQDGQAESRAELQITDMELGGAGAMSMEQAAAKLFPGS